MHLEHPQHFQLMRWYDWAVARSDGQALEEGALQMSPRSRPLLLTF